MNFAKTDPKLVCVGVGNSSIQFARFETRLPAHDNVLPVPIAAGSVSVVDGFAAPPRDDAYRKADWVVASVNRPMTAQLRAWVMSHMDANSFRVVENEQFPLEHRVPQLSRVGSDRLAAAVAVNRLRSAGHAAIFVDAGTALTVNVLSPEGEFLGGAILPGLGTSLRALARHTDQLPLVDLNLANSDQAPLAIGDHTEAAIRSGVYWGLVGAARELIARMSEQICVEPQILVTGGFGIWLTRELGTMARYEPHLVLSGLAITALGTA